ncbi:hypothetical protein ABW19_dt0206634 [Dactylella cylindrospora]|nr:hypothetical protein ABW19_dt0206634 [Dactylella cylindrospora]
MVQITFSQALVLLSAARLATAVQPLGGMPGPLGLIKRQAQCVDPVVCEISDNFCSSCPAGTYCTSDGGCCEVGQVCSGFKPCVNAGTPAPTETQVCPTDAPLCTVSAGIPVCSGTFEDWVTISQGLGGGATTTEAPTISTPPPEPSTTSTTELPTYESPSATTETSFYTPPPPSYTSYTTSIPTYTPTYTPPAENTTTTSAPVATGNAVKNQMQLGAVAGFFVFAAAIL